MNMRKARKEEMKDIFLMAYDVWSEGQAIDDYLVSSYTSSEYNDGEWYVLENASSNELLSSLILYDFKTEYEKIYGIGSVATPPHFRKQGHASVLLKKVIDYVMHEKMGTYIILYSDIDPAFYEKLGFVKAPELMQNTPKKICMFYPTVPPYL